MAESTYKTKTLWWFDSNVLLLNQNEINPYTVTKVVTFYTMIEIEREIRP